MTRNAWIIFIVLCIGVLGGLVYVSRLGGVDVKNIDANTVIAASKDSGNIADHVYGTKDSKVVMVEYGDYQCPGCGSAAPIVKKVYEKYKDKVTFIFRNYPLYSAHPNALAAASAAEAAGLQGKYWEMHDKLYENQDAWNQLTGQDRTKFFTSTATSLGIDGNKLASDMDSSAIKQKIDFDVSLGKKQRVAATPTFFLNGKELTQTVKDGKEVPSNTDGAKQIWADADALDKLMIQPALKQAGIPLE